MKKIFKTLLIILSVILITIIGLFILFSYKDKKINYTKDTNDYTNYTFEDFVYLNQDNTILNLDIPDAYLFFRYFNIDLININIKNTPFVINDISLDLIDDNNFNINLGVDLFDKFRIPLTYRYEYKVSEINTKAKLTSISIADMINVNRDVLEKFGNAFTSDLDINVKYMFIYEEMCIYSSFIDEISNYDDVLHIKYRIKDATHHYVVDTHFENDLKSYKTAHPELVNPGPEPTFNSYFDKLVSYYNNK